MYIKHRISDIKSSDGLTLIIKPYQIPKQFLRDFLKLYTFDIHSIARIKMAVNVKDITKFRAKGFFRKRFQQEKIVLESLALSFCYSLEDGFRLPFLFLTLYFQRTFSKKE